MEPELILFSTADVDRLSLLTQMKDEAILYSVLPVW